MSPTCDGSSQALDARPGVCYNAHVNIAARFASHVVHASRT